jgi:hypothetical protein
MFVLIAVGDGANMQGSRIQDHALPKITAMRICHGHYVLDIKLSRNSAISP